MNGSNTGEAARSRMGAVAAVALILAAAALGQALHVLATGEELCVGEGCSLVGRLTRVSPASFNLFGACVFLGIAALAWGSRRGERRVWRLALLSVATGALAAEGVLFAYQWQVAQAWCLYCLFLLAGVAGVNLLLGFRPAAQAFAAFAGSLTIFTLLTFVPARATLEAGTLAVRQVPGGPELTLFFSENCPHCRSVVAALRAKDRCTVRLNPVAEMPASFWPELDRNPGFDPRVNVAAARLLGLETIPILMAREPAGPRFLTGESAILRYVEEHCGEPRREEPSLLLTPWGGGSLLPPTEDGCGLAVECE